MCAFPEGHQQRVVSSAVEQLAFNQLVEGSNPSRPTTSRFQIKKLHASSPSLEISFVP